MSLCEIEQRRYNVGKSACVWLCVWERSLLLWSFPHQSKVCVKFMFHLWSDGTSLREGREREFTDDFFEILSWAIKLIGECVPIFCSFLHIHFGYSRSPSLLQGITFCYFALCLCHRLQYPNQWRYSYSFLFCVLFLTVWRTFSEGMASLFWCSSFESKEKEEEKWGERNEK